MEISISTGLLYKESAEEILDLIALSGCKNVEICMNQSFIDLSIATLKGLLDDRDLKAKSIHLPFSFLVYEQGLTEEDWIIKGIEYAKALNATVVVTHVFYKNTDLPLHNDESHCDVIHRYNQNDSLVVTTENLPPLQLMTIHQQPNQLLHYLETSNAYLTYDVTHSAAHGRDIIDDYELYKKHIRNIHISDYDEGHEHKIIGDGQLDFDAFISHLKKDGYDGLLTIELDFGNRTRNVIHSKAHALDCLTACVERLQAQLNCQETKETCLRSVNA